MRNVEEQGRSESLSENGMLADGVTFFSSRQIADFAAKASSLAVFLRFEQEQLGMTKDDSTCPEREI